MLPQGWGQTFINQIGTLNVTFCIKMLNLRIIGSKYILLKIVIKFHPTSMEYWDVLTNIRKQQHQPWVNVITTRTASNASAG